MRVSVVINGLPNIGHGGASLTAWSFVSALLDAGHEVTTVSLRSQHEGVSREEERVAKLGQLGSAVVFVPPPPLPETPTGRWGKRIGVVKDILWPSVSTQFNSVESANHVDEALRATSADVALVYTNEAVAATYRHGSVPLLAVVSDPPHVTYLTRLRYDPAVPWRFGKMPILFRVGELSRALHARRTMLAMLRRYPSVGLFAAHHAEWARKNGVKAWYARSPIVDLAGAEWRRRRTDAERNERPRILMIGHLRGVGTISGLHVLLDDVLPELDRALGQDGYEVHIVGGYDAPAPLRPRLDHPAVRLRGQIEPADDEFLRADVVLVTTPIKTGPRSRILSAASFGCCVVAHAANGLGIPELRHGKNVLFGRDGVDVAHQVVRALEDPGLRQRLGEAARNLYEESFTPEVAGAAIVRELERLGALEPAGRSA